MEYVAKTTATAPSSEILHPLLWESIAWKMGSAHWLIHSIIFNKYFKESTINHLLCWMLRIQRWIRLAPSLPSWNSRVCRAAGALEEIITQIFDSLFQFWLLQREEHRMWREYLTECLTHYSAPTCPSLCPAWQGAEPCRLDLRKRSRAKWKNATFLFPVTPSGVVSSPWLLPSPSSQLTGLRWLWLLSGPPVLTLVVPSPLSPQPILTLFTTSVGLLISLVTCAKYFLF